MLENRFDIPIIHQDLMNSTMPMMMPFGQSYLGGTRMRQQPDADKFITKNQKENEDKSTFKKVMIGLGVIGSCFVLAKCRKMIKKLFKRKSTP